MRMPRGWSPEVPKGTTRGARRVAKDMVRTKGWPVALLAVLVTAVPSHACADPSPPPNVYHSLDSSPGHPAGTIEGTIASVDYASGSLVVRGRHHVHSISLVPNTTIYHNGQYATLSDLRRGQIVRITVFQVGDRLVAKTITFK